MKQKAKKIFRYALKAVAFSFLVAIALLLLLPLWIGPVGKAVANSIVPKYTKSAFELKELSINPYTGYLHVGGVKLENPEGFSERNAFTLGALDVKISMSSLFTDTVQVREIAISDVFVSYVSHNGTNNFAVIAQSASADTAKTDKTEEKPSEATAEKKVIIDQLSISSLKVKLGILTVPILPISLSDIGKQSGGISFKDLWNELVAVVIKSSRAIDDAFKSFTGSVLDGAGSVSDAAAEAFSGTSQSFKEVGKSLKNLFK